MENQDLLARLQGKKLTENRIKTFIPTGSKALNYIISGDFNGGVPVGAITQFHGNYSSAKSAFATSVVGNAQKLGHYCIFLDAENTLSSEFSKALGMDPEALIYDTPKTLEEAFEKLDSLIKAIREEDKETPIAAVIDSLPVLPIKEELNADNYDSHNMIGAMRAKILGAALRRFHTLVSDQQVALIIINQIRNKVGVMYGNPETKAAGGMALDFYLSVDLKTNVPPAGKMKDDRGNMIGVEGTVKNTKNKVTIPFQECEFRLVFNEGFEENFGLLPLLYKKGIVDKSGAWYSFGDSKFQSKDFNDDFEGSAKLAGLRNFLDGSLDRDAESGIIGAS